MVTRLGRRVAQTLGGMTVLLAVTGCSIAPNPFSQEEIATTAKEDTAVILGSVPPIEAPLTLSEAMARALKYNLNNRVSVLEAALSAKNFELAKLDLLPQLTADGGYEWRNNFDATKSRDLETDIDSATHSYSDEKQGWDGSLRFSFNLLDFGVSYLRAKQEADRANIAQAARRNVTARLVQQVRTAFWRAAATQYVSPRVDELLERVQKTLDELEIAQKEGLRAPIDVLEEKRALYEIVQQLESMRQSIGAARIDLAGLIGAPPGTEFTLAFEDPLPTLPMESSDLKELELMALVNSVDYTEEMYNIRIAQAESRKAILRLFPGVEMFSAAKADTNDFLANKNWYEAGARVSWNLFSLLSITDIQESNEAREKMTVAKRLAANMAVITVMHLSWQEYVDAHKRLDQAKLVDSIDREIEKLTAQAEQSEATSGLISLRSEMRALRSTAASLLAYADAQDAYGTFLYSLGLSPVKEGYQAQSVEELSDTLGSVLLQWERGDFPAVVEAKAEDDVTS